MVKKLKIIGKSSPKLDGKERVSGKAVYGHDIMLPNMLYGMILRSQYPCARIKSIDCSEALALDGVECILTAKDVDVNRIGFKRDHPVFKGETVNCQRDEIAAVAATSRETARQALNLIKVDYEVMEGVFDPFEAMKDDARQINLHGKGAEMFGNKNVAESFNYSHGELEEQKKRSKVIVTRRYQLPRVTHC